MTSSDAFFSSSKFSHNSWMPIRAARIGTSTLNIEHIIRVLLELHAMSWTPLSVAVCLAIKSIRWNFLCPISFFRCFHFFFLQLLQSIPVSFYSMCSFGFQRLFRSLVCSDKDIHACAEESFGVYRTARACVGAEWRFVCHIFCVGESTQCTH